nr:alpha/beta hydrolase [Haloferula luteola]
MGFGWSGCCPLVPFREVRQSLPEREWVKVGDQQVHYLEWGKGGQPVLLIHGFGQSSRVFRRLGPLLAREGRVWAPDLSGFGWSERPRSADAYFPDGQVAMLGGFLEQWDGGMVDLVGHSYGADLALRFAATFPEKVRKVVLISPALQMGAGSHGLLKSAWIREAGYPVFRWWLEDPSRLRLMFERAYADPDLLDDETFFAYRSELLVEGLHDAYRGFGASLVDLETSRVGIESISQPVMILSGSADRIIPLEAVKSMAGEVPVKKLEGVGHVPPEEAPGEVAKQIRDFLHSKD